MRFATTVLIAVLLLLAAAPAAAFSESRAQDEVDDPLNHAFAVYLGGGLYVTGDSTVFIVRVSPKIRVRDEREHRFGVRVRLTASLGYYGTGNLTIREIPDLPDRIGTWALLPGVEFPIRIYDNWTLMPFGDIGVASDTEFNDTTIVTGFGARSRAEFKDDRHLHVLWNELVAAANHDQDLQRNDDYRLFRIDYEMRGIVDYRLFKRAFDLGLLLKSDTYLDRPLLGPDGHEIEVSQRFEVGFTTGATERWRTMKKLLTAPRLGVSYRFGEGTSGVRFVLRFRN